uniref:Uncharacterized protein n=1 Tax=Sphaerodactylus townsendi TaxID=933632 RepID=A0ACB8EEX1_9SAUR
MLLMSWLYFSLPFVRIRISQLPHPVVVSSASYLFWISQCSHQPPFPFKCHGNGFQILCPKKVAHPTPGHMHHQVASPSSPICPKGSLALAFPFLCESLPTVNDWHQDIG